MLRHALKYFAVAERAARVMQRAYRTRMARVLMAHLKAKRQVLAASAAYRKEAAARATRNPRTAWEEENRRRAVEWQKQQREWVVYNRQQELEQLQLLRSHQRLSDSLVFNFDGDGHNPLLLLHAYG